jgi:hypothetical protein
MYQECVIQKGINIGAVYLEEERWKACDFPPQLEQ